MLTHLLSKLAFQQTFIIAAVLFACLVSAPARADLGDELFKLTASDAAATGVFGFSVGVSDNVAIVGAYGFSFLPGSAYLVDATTGQELRKLTASDTVPFDYFGYSVAISGNTAIVGAPGDNDLAGSAYLFDVTTGQELFKLSAASGKFGQSVAISGNTALIGSDGSAYLFDVTTGQELFKLTDEASSYHSVAISGNIAIVGAPRDSGAAYLFDVTTGQELFKLTASDAAEFDGFGGSVAISGNIAIVGASGDDDAGEVSGSAYLFDVTTGQELFKLTASDAAPLKMFGSAVAISGNLAIISSQDLYEGHLGFFNIGAGSAYVFDVATRQQLAKLTAFDAANNDAFGNSVAISGNVAFVGSPYDHDYTGSVYVYSVVPEPASLALLALGLPLLVWRRSRRSGAGGIHGGRFDLTSTSRTVALARSDQ